MRDDYIIQSVQKALKVLKIFDSTHQEMTLTELSNISSISKGSMIRILTTLQKENFISYNEKNKKYQLGIALYKLGNNVFNFSDLVNVARPYLEDSTKRMKMIAHLGSLYNNKVILVDRVYPSQDYYALDLDSTIGGDLQVHSTGVGKIITAFATKNLQDQLIGSCSFEKITDNTITDKEVFIDLLQKIRKQGYAINCGEHEDFLKCITYPIFDYTGEICGALSFTGIISSFDKIEDECHEELSTITANISRRLGYKNN